MFCCDDDLLYKINTICLGISLPESIKEDTNNSGTWVASLQNASYVYFFAFSEVSAIKNAEKLSLKHKFTCSSG